MMFRDSENGFTLVEIMVSIAILSIVSGVLFQVFVVATRIDKKASDLDKANIFAVQEVEEYKATSSAAYVNVTKYYDGDFQETAAGAAKYKVDTSFTNSLVSQTGNYYSAVNAAFTCTLQSTDTFISVSTDSDTTCSIFINGISQASHLDWSSNYVIKKPLNIVYPASGSAVMNVHVDNKAKSGDNYVELPINVFNAKNQANVNITPDQNSDGVYSVSYITDKSTSYNNYNINLKITRIEDSVKILDYSNTIYSID